PCTRTSLIPTATAGPSNPLMWMTMLLPAPLLHPTPSSLQPSSAPFSARPANLNNNSYKGMDETAFAFSLIPATKPSERKSIFTANGKNHHFAVKTRDERINWMRELMLAKALKKGKEAGNKIKMNGNFI
ncbi:hypothetical protein TESG_07957, partial [Trichophyton tonsurans CBS 112818]